METYVCKSCNYTTVYKGHYARHQKTKKHLNNTSKSTKSKNNKKQKQIKEKDVDKQFKFKTSSEYRLQSRQLYDRFLDNLDKLENPIKNVHDPRYTTNSKGDYKIISKANFDIENDTQIKNKKFQCHYCDDIFQDVWSLIQHFSSCNEQEDFSEKKDNNIEMDDDYLESDSDKSVASKDSDWERRNKNPLDDYPEDQKPPFYIDNGERDTKREHDFFKELIKKSEELLNKIEGIENNK